MFKLFNHRLAFRNARRFQLNTKDKIQNGKTWNDITLAQFKAIKDILSDEQDEYTAFNLLDIVYGIDSANMNISELSKFPIEFLKQNVPNVKLKDKYVLNGTSYCSNFNLTEVKTGQFVDYQNYIKQGAAFEKLLSVFFTPEGHTYNDGYDVSKVQQDLLTLDIPTVCSAAFFFKTQLSVYTTLFQRSLIRQVKKMKIDKAKKKETISLLKQMDFNSLVSFTGSGIIPIRQIRL